MSNDQTPDIGWAIVEIMGRRRLAGYVTEQTIAGAGFVRVDVPVDPPATQFYSPSSIYALTPCSEETARKAAGLSEVEPVFRWELPAPRERETVPPDADIEHEEWED